MHSGSSTMHWFCENLVSDFIRDWGHCLKSEREELWESLFLKQHRIVEANHNIAAFVFLIGS